MTHTYSRPGGMTPHELDKTRRRLAGRTLPNASGATQREAPAILAGSEPSRELTPPAPTPEEIAATAEANRKLRVADTLNVPDPVNGEIDPLDAEHESIIDDDDAADLIEARRMASAGEPLISADGSKPENDSLLD